MTDDDFDTAFKATLDNFAKWVVDTSLSQAKTWPNGDKLVGLAKELCADDPSYPGRPDDTDRVVVGGGGSALLYDVKKTVLLQLAATQIRPAWWHYLPEAKKALDYLGAEASYQDATRFLETVREVRP